EIAWAVVLTICLKPVRMRLAGRLGATRTALLLTVLVLLLIVLPLVFIATTAVAQGAPAIAYLEQQLRNQGGPAGWFHSAWTWARARASFLPPEQEVIGRITASLGTFVQYLAGQAGGFLASAAGVVFSLVITLAVLFFLLRDADRFALTLRRVLPFGAEQNALLLAIASELVSASVTASLAVAAIQGLVGGVTFALLGIQGPALWGVIMAVLSFVPVVGATLVWGPAAIWLALSGSLTKGLILGAVGGLIMGQVDNVIRPLLLSGRSQMNTLVLIISLLGGVGAFGFIGIVLGPLVAALVTALVASYQVVEEVPAAEVAAAASPPAVPNAEPPAGAEPKS
ncbi:MAG TPA: AI-2E family transporter, partial [Vicinamibacteria bacterium]|nr:AI-2E family transporter [Vicinamibacteria bacterium]